MQHLQNPASSPVITRGVESRASLVQPPSSSARVSICLISGRRWRGVPFCETIQQLVNAEFGGGCGTGEHESQPAPTGSVLATMSGMGETGSIEIQQLRELKGPLVDVGSPGEFEKGHWPGAINVPFFNDEERAAVGTAYKQHGRTPAIHLGLELTGPKLSSLALQLESLRHQGDPRIYCWRGGMRSASVAWLAQQIGLRPRLLQGVTRAIGAGPRTALSKPGLFA